MSHRCRGEIKRLRIWRRGVLNNMLLTEVFGNIAPCCLWAYNGPMEIVNFPERGNQELGARGKCPHCDENSYFHPVATHLEGGGKGISAARCQGCKEYVLVIAHRQNVSNNQSPFVLDKVLPTSKPNDFVDANVPKEIAEDFREALRCHWINAYKASVVMCGRAVQASAIELGAEGDTLVRQIDDLAKKGIITEPLRKFAHAVRLTRNIGAHPDKDGLKDVTEKDATDIIEFTREFLHHVYVMPAKLKARFP